MQSRRSLLACCGAGMAALAGCAGYRGDQSTDEDGASGDTPTDLGAAPRSVTISGDGPRTLDADDLPVPKSALLRGAARNAIPAVVDPVFGADWSGISMQARTRSGMEYLSKPRLAADDRVIGVARGDSARAYPLKLLRVHEVVNDSFAPPAYDGPAPLLVTYCPLCGSALTAVRTVDGSATDFGVSGLLYRNDLVMYDRATESLWSQVAATAIRGPAVGSTLALVPSSLTTWGEWRDAHPETAVLRPPPESGTIVDASPGNYDLYPYGRYRTNDRVGLGGSYDDDRLHPKTTVVGVTPGRTAGRRVDGTAGEQDDGTAVAYPRPIVDRVGVVTDRVGSRPVVVATTPEGTLVAYDRWVDGEARSFERADEDHLEAGGSRWRLTTGVAVDGTHEGTRLRNAATVSPLFFFAWTEFHPETAVYGIDHGPDIATGTVTPSDT